MSAPEMDLPTSISEVFMHRAGGTECDRAAFAKSQDRDRPAKMYDAQE
jgi:hypothetical protein